MLGRSKLPKDPRVLDSMPVTDRANFPTTQGLYWGIAGNEVLYTGMTLDPDGFRDRWRSHEQYAKLAKVNARIHFLPLNPRKCDINTLETEAIRRWWPPWNKAKKAKRYKPKGQPHKLPRRLPEWVYVWLAIALIGIILILG